MTDSLISLISIVVGIVSALLIGYYKPKYSYGFVGNTIAGVFGSIFIIKTFGRLGFDPSYIVKSGNTNYPLFILNLVASIIGGGTSIFFVKTFEQKTESKEKFSMNLISSFRLISLLEGLSYILLLFVAVPLKYFADQAGLVKLLGMPHGILFVLYVVLALIIRSRMKWGFKSTLLVLIASLLPFGTFYIEHKYFRDK